MATTIDWPTKVINVPRADMLLIQSVPVEIRELDLNDFRLSIAALQAGFAGMVEPTVINHSPPVAVGGVELARVVEIINGYTLTLEDGQYAVNLKGANSNVADRVNVNQVSVRASNSAGLVTSAAIEFGEFQARVTVQFSSSYSGTAYPVGTLRRPVNNLADAKLIANARGFKEMLFLESGTIDTEDFSNFLISGVSQTTTFLVIDTSANVINCEFVDCSISGILDGGSTIRGCIVGSLAMVNGIINSCIIDGPVTLGGVIEAVFTGCSSGVSGQLPTIINMGGDGPPLIITHWSGVLELTNKTGSTYDASIDVESGRVIVASTVIDGSIVVRGVGKLTDNSTGTATVISELLDSAKLNEVHQIHGLDSANPMTVTTTARIAGQIAQTITGDGQTTSTVTRDI
jgi:hypothetical protein